MKDFTIGTFIASLALAFLMGFVTCHELYGGLDLQEKFDQAHDKHSNGR